MSLDVVKTNSNFKQTSYKACQTLLIITILISWQQALSKVFKYTSLNQTCPLIIKDIQWKNPDVIISFSTPFSNKITSKKIPYLKIRSSHHFELIKEELKENITRGFYKKNELKKIYIHRPFPFKKIIYAILLTLAYPIFQVYFSRLD